MNAILSTQFSDGSKFRLNKVKASGGCHDFSEVVFRASSKKNRAQIRQGAFDRGLLIGKIHTFT